MTKRQIWLSVIFGVIFSIGLYDFLYHFKTEQELLGIETEKKYNKKDSIQKKNKNNLDIKEYNKKLISELTNEQVIINYIKKYHKLPKYYITKAEAKQQGWIPSKGNLCEALPGKAIGGDYFKNKENKLPIGNQYFEADVNYQCGKRTADRVIFTRKGEVWLSKDHYKTFEKQ